jgi:hypothetical protein
MVELMEPSSEFSNYTVIGINLYHLLPNSPRNKIEVNNLSDPIEIVIGE